jgi:hypothetical protein
MRPGSSWFELKSQQEAWALHRRGRGAARAAWRDRSAEDAGGRHQFRAVLALHRYELVELRQRDPHGSTPHLTRQGRELLDRLRTGARE